MNLSEYAAQDGLALAALIRSGEVSVDEVVACAHQAIEQINPQINAIIEVFDAPETAQIDNTGAPYFGVPLLVKDLVLHLAGRRIEFGSRLAEGLVLPHDTDLMRAFRTAGLYTLGRASTPELGYCTTTEPVMYGPTRNPWDLERMAGGSSGATSAAVAAGIVPVAHANDGGGSIRIPAACCGLVGLKPTRGRTPTGPDAAEGLNGLGIEFVVTRTVRDCATMLDAVQGPGLGDPYVIAPPLRAYAKEIQSQPGKLKIAFTDRAWSGDEVDADACQSVRDAAKLCESLGHNVVEASPSFDYEAYKKASLVYWNANLAHGIDELAGATGRKPGRDTLEATTLACYEHGKTYSGMDVLNAFASANNICRAIAPFFTDYDVLLTPTNAGVARPVGTYSADNPALDALGWYDHIFAYACFTAVFNMTGQPAISLPLARSADGLPLGLQFVGRYGDEATLLRLAKQLEEATPWPQLAPLLNL